MSYVIEDPTGAALQDLRIDTPGVSPYRKILVYNNSVTSDANILVSLLETGFSKTDQAYLGNRSVISASYTHSVRGAETSYVASGPVSTAVQLTAELTLTILDGLLQLSQDTFVWASSQTIASLAAQGSQPIYARYNSLTYPFTTRLTLKNFGPNTFSNITLTPPATDQLSTNGTTYQNPGASINIGTLNSGGSVTFWLRSYSIQNIIAAQIQVISSGGTGLITVPVQAAGSRAYCLANDVRQYLTQIDVGVVTNDDEIMNLITTSSKEIDRATRRRFDVVTVTERYNGSGQQKLVLDNYPIIAIQEVQIINPDNEVVTDIKSTDQNFATELIIDFVNGFITLPSASVPALTAPLGGAIGSWYPPLVSFPPVPSRGVPYDYVGHFGEGISNIVVTYTYGFQQPPEPIRQACMKLVVIELSRKKGTADSQGLSTEGMAGATFQYSARGTSGGAGPFGHLIAELQNDVNDILTQYRKKSWLSV